MRGACSQRGVGKQHHIPQHQIFGVGWEAHGLFAIRRYNISSCREEGQFPQGFRAFLPKAGASSPRQLDTSHWPIFTSPLLMEKVNLLRFPFSWYAGAPEILKEPGSNPGSTARCLPENSFPPGSPCSGSFPSSVSRDGTHTHRETLTGGMRWSRRHMWVPGHGGARPSAQHTSGFARVTNGQDMRAEGLLGPRSRQDNGRRESGVGLSSSSLGKKERAILEPGF